VDIFYAGPIVST